MTPSRNWERALNDRPGHPAEGGAVAWTLSLLGFTGLIGLADVASGSDIGMSLFYLLPIVAAGWYLGRAHAGVIAGVAALVWFAADLQWKEVEQWHISTWNGLTRLGIFLAMGLLTAQVRRDQRRTQQLLNEANRLARTDWLTGLPNSRSFFEGLNRELAATADGTPVALACIDVDNFKLINDVEGHEAGDALLRDIASCMARHAAQDALMARLGGDEFALVFLGTPSGRVSEILARLLEETRQIGLAHPHARLGLSVGVAHAATPCSVTRLLATADEAMYRVKREHHSGEEDRRRGAAGDTRHALGSQE